MMSKLSTHKVVTMVLLLLALLCTQLMAVTPAQARSHAGQQKAPNCHTTVASGWRPYRPHAGDTLDALAAQARVSVAELMQINCLTSAAISADTLLLLPVLGSTKGSGVLAAPVPAAPVLADNALLTVISTTTTSVTTSATAMAANPAPWSTMPWPWLAMVAFGFFSLAVFLVGARPVQPGGARFAGRFGLWSNVLFLFLGLFLGMVVFPELRLPALTTLPSSVSTSVTVALIGLLVAKELFFKGAQWRSLNRMLNVGLVPLLLLFFLTVATRVAETIN